MAQASVLNIFLNGESIRSLPVEGEMILGRGEGCVIKLPDRSISRQHAILRASPEGIQIERKSEFAPLSVNGAECTRALIKEGDVISIGPYLLKLSAGAKSPEPQAFAPAPKTHAPVIALDCTQIMEVPLSFEMPPVSEQIPVEHNPVEEGEALPDFGVLEQASQALAQNDPLDLPEIRLDAPPVVSQLLEIPEVSQAFKAYTQTSSVDEHGETKVVAPGKIDVKLVFPEGSANHTEFVVEHDEIFIGRGKESNVVLADKKASRKNSVLKRKGLKFFLQDLESSNGTYVNGEKISEKELSSGDVIRIGNVEFKFMATSADYASIEKDFAIVLPFDPGPQAIPPPVNPALLSQTQSRLRPEQPPIPGIDGIGISPSKRKFSLVAWFYQQRPFTKLLVLLLAGFFIWWAMEEDEPTKTIKAKKGVAQTTGTAGAQAPKGVLPPGYENLLPEQKRFVEAQRNLALDYFKNKEYDRSLFELNKIFSLIPDYKDAREIERYAKEGKRKLEALEEEKRRHDEEEKVKARVNELVEETKHRMDEKNYAQAKELFGEILALDPENTSVTDWKKSVEAWEEDQARIAQEKQVQGEINKHGWEIYADAQVLFKQRRYHRAIAGVAQVFDIGSADKKLLAASRGLIARSKAAIAGARDPVLADAKQAEEASDLPKAYKLFEKASVIDPGNMFARDGMQRIRGVLHDRAKGIYTEAVIAESYSDFATAKKKYAECMDVAPKDDIYHERSERKISRFIRPASTPDGAQ